MKFFFPKTDSLYKIFKTLEKIPPQKATQVFIDPDHPFFENQRWGKQVKHIITERNLNITFLTEKESNRKYFQQLDLNINHKAEKPIVKFLKTLFTFLFDVKKFHLYTYAKQKYIFYLIFVAEILSVLGILRFLIGLILPHATITIKVAQHTEDIIYNFRYYPHGEQAYLGMIKQISIPYFTGDLNHEYLLAISTENLKHIANPSEGRVKIYNQTSREFQLVKNTKFITDKGLIFLSKDALTLAPGLIDNPSETRVKLYAAEMDSDENIIGNRGNIPKNTKLKIKNLKDSYHLGQVWAESIEPFSGGTTTSLGTISGKDKEILANKIRNSVYADKMSIVQNSFKQKDTVVLMFDSLIKTTFKALSIEGNIGDKATTLKGKADISFSFLYLKWSDVINAFTQYIQQRQSESMQLINIDMNTLTFIDNVKGTTNDQLFVIPTKATVLQGYDFKKDTKGILATLKNNIAGKSVKEAKKLILEYAEIASVKIDLGFLQGNTLPSLKSRISIHFEL